MCNRQLVIDGYHCRTTAGAVDLCPDEFLGAKCCYSCYCIRIIGIGGKRSCSCSGCHCPCSCSGTWRGLELEVKVALIASCSCIGDRLLVEIDGYRCRIAAGTIDLCPGKF